MTPTWGDGANEAHAEAAAPGSVVLDETATANIVRVFGDIDRASVHLFERALERAGQHRSLVIDFTHCRYLDSSVLSALVRAHGARPEALRVVLPEDHRMRRIFAITNLDAVLSIVTDLDAAQRSIRAARPRTLRVV
jgi:anti-anti-sigma factor